MLGDFVDADNPASWDTLQLIRELTERGAVAIPGNHELKLVAEYKRSVMRRRTSIPGKLASYAKWITALPFYHIEQGMLFVHAGIRPGIPLAAQTVRDLTEIREDFLAFPLRELAAFIEGDDSNRGQRIWRRIMFGHTPTFKLGAPPGEIWSDERRIAIDTGSKQSCRLTLLDVGSGDTYSCATEPGYQSHDFRQSTAKDRLQMP